MPSRRSRNTQGTRFAGFLVAVLIALLILVFLASRYRKINPTPKLDRKGMATLLNDGLVPDPGAALLGAPPYATERSAFQGLGLQVLSGMDNIFKAK